MRMWTEVGKQPVICTPWCSSQVSERRRLNKACARPAAAECSWTGGMLGCTSQQHPTCLKVQTFACPAPCPSPKLYAWPYQAMLDALAQWLKRLVTSCLHQTESSLGLLNCCGSFGSTEASQAPYYTRFGIPSLGRRFASCLVKYLCSVHGAPKPCDQPPHPYID